MLQLQLQDTLAAAVGVSGSDGCLGRQASMQECLLTLLLLHHGLTTLPLLVLLV
jgi:hypothetical protein